MLVLIISSIKSYCHINFLVWFPLIFHFIIFFRCLDKRYEQRVRTVGPGLKLRVELHTDEPGMAGQLDDFHELVIG